MVNGYQQRDRASPVACARVTRTQRPFTNYQLPTPNSQLPTPNWAAGRLLIQLLR
ncbi:MAG: hypothetical protein ACHBN1_24860 [Heteroscytonema crispum UTEX LB 1556]